MEDLLNADPSANSDSWLALRYLFLSRLADDLGDEPWTPWTKAGAGGLTAWRRNVRKQLDAVRLEVFKRMAG
jgi:hypothetical protein